MWPPHDRDQKKHGKGHDGRHLSKTHDEDFFVVRKNTEEPHFDERDHQGKHEKKNRNGGMHDKKRHHDDHERPSATFRHSGEHGEAPYKVDKAMLEERRITRMVTRATFLSFLMWTFVFIGACIGSRVVWFKEHTRWVHCSFKKSVFFIVIASLLGVWKMHAESKIFHELKHMHRQQDMAQ